MYRSAALGRKIEKGLSHVIQKKEKDWQMCEFGDVCWLIGPCCRRQVPSFGPRSEELLLEAKYLLGPTKHQKTAQSEHSNPARVCKRSRPFKNRNWITSSGGRYIFGNALRSSPYTCANFSPSSLICFAGIFFMYFPCRVKNWSCNMYACALFQVGKKTITGGNLSCCSFSFCKLNKQCLRLCLCSDAKLVGVMKVLLVY